MAFPIWAAMAIAGAAKGYQDKQQEKRDRHAAAVTKLYQPFTGMQADPIQKGDIMGSAMQGGAAGFGIQQSMDQNKMFQDMMQKQQFQGMDQNQMGLNRANKFQYMS
jgi:hypothetical protein